MFGLKERRAGPRTEEHADTQARRIGLSLIFYFVLPVLILFLVYRLEFRQVMNPDVMDMATVGRNMVSRHGFTTSAVRPLYLTVSKDVLHMPDLIHAPLYPTALMFFLALGPSDLKVFLTSALFFWLTLPVLYFLARGMFNQKVAMLTLFAYVSSTFMVNMLLEAGSGTMAAFMFTSLCLVLYGYAQRAANADEVAPDTKQVLRSAGLAGLLMALCYLTDYMLLFTLVPVAAFVYVAGGRARKAGLGVFLVAFLVPAGLWWIRNIVVGVNPFFGMRSLEIAMGTQDHPGLSLYRVTDAQDLLPLLQGSMGDVGLKFLKGIQNVYTMLTSFGQPYLAGFFLVGLFYSFRRIGVNAMRGMVLTSFACVLIFGSLGFLQPSVLAAFMPVFTAFAAAYFVRLLTDARLPGTINRIIMTGAVVILAFPLVISLAFVRPPAIAHGIEASIGGQLAPNTPVLTDRVFEMAWYGGRTAVWLPYTEKDFKELSKDSKPQAIYLSANLQRPYPENYGYWSQIWGQTVQGLQGGQIANISKGPLAGFMLYRDMSEDDMRKFAQNGACLFLRAGGVRQTAQ